MSDTMHLPGLIPAEAAAVFGGITSRRGAIAMLAERMGRAHGADTDMLATSLLAREAIGSTGFGNGVAIPHGYLPAAEKVIGAILLLQTPVDWDAPDGQPVDLVIGLAGPEGTPMLKALARVSRFLRNPQLVAKLRGARDAHALWSLIAIQEIT